MVVRARRTLAKRREVIRKAALDYHGGRITLGAYLRVVAGMRAGR